ncbi:MAG: DMT family transporter [Alphaproteobacteria bacterium]|nr:DMT family transporter [Alphaproteobacteria bacterium]
MTDTLRGAILVVVATLLFSIETVFVKMLAGEVPIAVLILLRSWAQLVWVLPSFARHGLRILRTDRLGLQLLRGFFSLFAWTAHYYAFSYLPISTATVLTFTSALFTTALAGPVLGEHVGWRRWSAAIVGFMGVLIVLRPGILPIGLPVLASLAAALLGCAIGLTTKALARTERTDTIMAYVGLVLVAGTTPVGVMEWVWPTPWQWLLLGTMAPLGALGLQLWIGGLRLGDASAYAPLQYLRLVYAEIAGVFIFTEYPDRWSIVGAMVVVASAAYITQREAMLARRARLAARQAATRPRPDG